jgi:TonB family protein
MKKIIVLITFIYLALQGNLKAQENLTILDKLNNSNEKSTYLKDFNFELNPGENAKYSVVLSKDTKYEFSMYLNNSQLDFELYKDKTETNLLTEKEKLTEQIIKVDYIIRNTGVYHLVIRNKSNKIAKSVLLLSFFGNEENSTISADGTSSDNNINTSSTFENEEVFVIVEQMPLFGDEKNPEKSSNLFREFIAKNLTYPEEAKTKKIKGRVYVSFVVDKEGYIKSAKVVRGVHPALDQEALRVILSSPRWEPGKEKGKPVNVTYTIPIIFELN